jgi:hypothetical protein
VHRLILSRKGFDGSAGGGDSPMLPDGRLVSLPIPENPAVRPTARVRFDDLRLEGLDYLTLLRSLYPRRSHDPHRSFDNEIVHLDPDLVPAVLEGRATPSFRGLFGQAGSAAQHLLNQGVGEGDLFLFFGRFRATEATSDGSYRFLPHERSFHAVFGYLEVDERIVMRDDLRGERYPPARAWAPDFPHFLPTYRKRPGPEVVFIGKEKRFGPLGPCDDGLRLTRPESDRLCAWRLPASFDEVDVTYNPRTAKRDWRVCGEYIEFFAASRGQEFVCRPTSAVRRWAENLVAEHAAP